MIKFILLLFLSIQLYPQNSERAVEFNLKFTAKHPFKIVNGVCKKPEILGLELQKVYPPLPIGEFTVSCLLMDMKTGDSNRDSHMREVLGFPSEKNVEFKISKTILNKDEYEFSGILIINGKKKEKTFKSKFIEKDDSILINGKENISLSEFEITPPSLLFISVNEKVNIEFEIKIKK